MKLRATRMSGNAHIALSTLAALVASIYVSAAAAGVPAVTYDFGELASTYGWRKNLLAYSEQLDNVLWAKGTTASVTPNTAIAPDGTLSADTVLLGADTGTSDIAQNFPSVIGQTYTISIWLWAAVGQATQTQLILADTVTGNTITIVQPNLTTTPTRFTVSGAAVGANTRLRVRVFSNSTDKTLYAWGGQAVSGAAMGVYQRMTDGAANDFMVYSPTYGLFQDNLGTLPVMAVEQPIGLALDKSRGGARGAQLWTPPPTYIDPNWTNNGDGSFTSNGSNGFVGWASASNKLIAGRVYEATMRVVSRTSGAVNLPYDGAGGNQQPRSAIGTYRWVFTAISTGLNVYSSAFVGTVDSISLREIPGTHALQATSTARPVVDGRVNQLLYSQDFSNVAGWAMTTVGTGVAPVIATAYATAPDGSNTANRVQFSTGAGVTTGDISQVTAVSQPTSIGGTYTSGIWLKSNTGVNQTLHVTDITGATTSIVVTPAWQQFTLTRVATATASIPVRFRLTGNAATSADIQAWGGQFETSSTLGPYQRIGAATDYNAAGFPITARFDGVDDWLVSSAANFSTTDRITLITGIRKTSDAAGGAVVELSPISADGGPNPGTFGLYAPLGAAPSNDISWRGQGSTALRTLTKTAMPAPTPYVVTGILDLNTPNIETRFNGVSQGKNALAMGGNFGTYPLYIGRRGGTSLPFAGKIARIDIIGRTLSPGDIYALERLNRQQLTGNTL